MKTTLSDRDAHIIDSIYSGEACRTIAPRVGLSSSGVQAAFVRAVGRSPSETLPAALFFARVDMSGGDTSCWPWTGRLHTAGYGLWKNTYTHRTAWELFVGPIPEGLYVCHHCDNPPCCNPIHLFLGTHLDNIADMVAKGRNHVAPLPRASQPRGERHGVARLTEPLVREIRDRVAAGESQSSVARSLDVHVMTVNSVVHRRTWGHVK